MVSKLLSALAVIGLFLMPNVTFAQAPNLGTAANFVLFTSVGAVTNTGVTHLTGNVGSNAGSSTGFGNVNGGMHDGDGVSGACAADLLTAYHQLNIAVPTFYPAPLLGDGDTLVAGVYHISSAATLDSNLILNAQGNPNAVFIFQIQGSLSVNAASKVKLINGAVACNVFWKVEGLVSIASATFMRGTIVANNAAINMSPNDTLEGRALSTDGAVSVNGILAYTPIGCGSALLTGPVAPVLASVGQFGIFSSTGNVTNTGITHVVGDVGTNVGLTTGFDSAFVTGNIHPIPDDSTAAAVPDLTVVYNYLNTLPTDIELLYPAQFGNDLVLTPHTYLMNSAPTFTGNVYLDAEGDNNAVFVIKINGALSTTTFSKVILINGAQAKNIYWKVDGATDISGNSLFNGTIVVNNAAINLSPGSNFVGRALTTNGVITTNGINLSLPVTAPCTAPPIGGTLAVCTGSSTALTDSTGGTWSSSDIIVATIDSASGVAMGITNGTSTVSYTSQAGCVSTAVITVNQSPSVIVGPGSVCVGSSITLTDAITGGSWTSGNPSQATVGTGSGIVTGVANGTPTITYRIPNNCIATKNIIVGNYAGVITGPSNVCIGSVAVLTDTVAGGTWSGSNGHGLVAGNSVTGLSAGIDTITYTVTNLCGTATASKAVTIDTTAIADSISGPSAVCVGSSITLTDSSAGGIWSASNTNATVLSGMVTGVSAGIDTIRYTVINTCGSATATKTVTVNPLPDEGAITGPGMVCTGSTITLTDFAPGGTWSASNANATVSGDTVTGVTPGTDTIKYIVTNTCGTATATKTVTVNASPNAGVINGPSNVCVGSTITLTDAVTGGIWSMSNAHATVAGGFVTGVTSGIDTVRYTVTSIACTSTATKAITVDTIANAGIITGPSAVCTGSSIALTDVVPGGTWSASNTHAFVIGGTTTGVTAGIDTIKYIVTNVCGTSTATMVVTVNASPNAGVITGPSNVCVGSSVTLTDAAAGGIWSMSNAHATVIGGVTTGVTGGVDTIKYTVTNLSCTSVATKQITIDTTMNAGVITGPSAVCRGSSITLTDLTTGGVWSVTNADATVLAGVVTGVTAGIDTVVYTVSNSCGTDTATKLIVLNPAPGAGVINGPSSVCVGSTITLTDASAGGTWSASNADATVVGGIVTGLTSGLDTIMYTVFSAGCSATATKTVTVNPLPFAGVITGPSTVCTGSSIALTDLVTGGTWSASNTNATVLGGIVTGITAGIDTIMYKVTSGCGADSATMIVVVNATPSAGVINGPSSVCVGSSITLTDAATGGEWSASNANATVSDGTVTGLTAGMDTIMYSVFSVGCSAVATKLVTVNALADAGVITGSSAVCTGSAIALTDLAPGGTWSASNANATVAGGIVTGVAAGIDTIEYIVVNTCSISVATKMVTVNATPDAGVINGPSNVCVGSTIILTDAATGGEWSASNTDATIVNGIVTGIAAGSDTIMYTVFSAGCSAVATKTITIDALADAGVVTGPSNVCVGSSIVLTDVAAGGTWSASNSSASVLAGVVTGVSAGVDTIMYTVSNTCGATMAAALVTVTPLPDAGIITGPSSVCVGSSVTFTDTASGGAWSASNGNALALGNLILGAAAGTDTIIYTVTNTFCTAIATKSIVVNMLPNAGTISGASVVCVGSSVSITDTTAGGNWSASNTNATLTPIAIGNSVMGVTPGADTITYTFTNTCGTDTATKTITVMLAPAVPVISTQSPSSACSGTMYQNFGAATPAPTGTVYTWSATNAAVFAQGAGHQYALVNFDEPGTAVVTLSATIPGASCSSQATVTVTVGTSVSAAPEVVFFNNHFVCTPANEDSYQWGYDNIITLDSSILVGEINQDYLNESPDFAHKLYWVMTSLNGCSQKTYYITPAAITTVNNDATELSLYPNPASDRINLEITSAVIGPVQVEVVNMLGQKIASFQASDNKASIDVAMYPAGGYFVTCYRNGVRVGSARFIKN